MSETKKRPHAADDDEQLRPKKRAASDDHRSSSRPNGVAAHGDEPTDSDNLETFRKDAIFRRMKHYAREYERSEARVAELERRRTTCEAGLAALEASWTQFLGTIRLLMKPDDLKPPDVDTEDLIDLVSHVSADPDQRYVDALRKKMQETSELVAGFVRLASEVHIAAVDKEAYKGCQKAQTESAALRSELSFTRTRLRDVQQERDEFHEDLVVAEKRLDRLQSKIVAVVERKETQAETEAEPSVESPPSPAPQPQQPALNGHADDTGEWRAIAEVREKHIGALTKEVSDLKRQVLDLRADLQYPSEEVIASTAYCKTLLVEAEVLRKRHQADEGELQVLQKECDSLQKSRQELQDSAAAASHQGLQELRSMLSKRNDENTRLREQRDQQQAELSERKHRDQVKLNSLHEYKHLAESRAERIKSLLSENTRLKTRLAANSGDEDVFSFFLQLDSQILSVDDEHTPSYFAELKQRAAVAESRVAALEASLAQLDQKHPDVGRHLKLEAEVREQLAQTQQQLQRYQGVYGVTSSGLPPDAQDLAERLRTKEDELRRLQLSEQQREKAESALYNELAQLSAAWEGLDRQVKSKLFDLSGMEERLTKSNLEKVKSDNKFYSAMRDKESVETERKNLSRTMEKQAKVIERSVEIEKALKKQLHAMTSERDNWQKRALLEYRESHAGTRTIDDLQKQVSTMQQRLEALKDNAWAKDKTVEDRAAALRKMEEDVARSKAETERLQAKLKAQVSYQSASSGTREAQLQSEIDKCMSILKCSTCKQNMRNTVITKCMHSFCKSCVESRIATRQRKCPACNLAFSQGEVQQLYFQ